MEKGFQNSEKNVENFLKKSENPNATGVSAFYIVDILIAEWAAKIDGVAKALTVSEIQEILALRHKVYYSHKCIRLAVGNVGHYMHNIILQTRNVRVGPKKKPGCAFFIEFKK